MCFSPNLSVGSLLILKMEKSSRSSLASPLGKLFSLDHPASSSELLGRLPISYLDVSLGSRRRQWMIIFKGQAITIC